MIERLVGMQAQVPENPYVALWSRIEGFRPEMLSDLIAERRAVRAAVLRPTIHLVTARDCLTMHPINLPLLARAFRSPWGGGLNGVPVDEVVEAGRELLRERPLTRLQLSAALAPRWPEADPASLAYAVTYHLPIVQVPPRGLWGGRGQATWAPTEDWLGAPLDPEPALDALVLRYLAAFGPATPADARTWCGLSGLREVFERLRPQLRTFSDERGRELFDVPNAPLPDPDTPAPPRLLPEYDNVLLAHDDRSRITGDRSWPLQPFPRGKWIGTVLVDGFYRANWRLEDGEVRILGFSPEPSDPPGSAAALEAEAARLAAFLAA